MSERHIDDLFRQALENHEVSPPFRNWDKIQQHLPESVPFYRKPSFKAGMAAVLVLTISLGVLTTRYFLSPVPATQLAIQEPAAPENSLPYVAGKSHAEGVAPPGVLARQAPQQSTGIPIVHPSIQPLSENNATLRHHSSKSAAPARGKQGTAPESTPLAGVLQQQPPVLHSTAEGVNNTVAIDLTKINPAGGTKMPSNTLINSNFAAETKAVQAVEPLPPALAQTITQNQTAGHNVINAVSVIGKPKKPKTHGLYLGSFYSVHNSWLLNNKALEATKNIDAIHYRFRTGKSYGMNAGIDFSANWGLQTEWVIKSVQGQALSYRPLESVTNQNTEINLTYTYVPVLLKYKFNRTLKLTGQPAVLNYVAGVQYGTLKSAEINLNNPILQENLLKKSLWGVVAGVDYDVYLTPNYFITLGARASFSTSSGRFTQINMPGNGTANQLVWGLRAGLNYRFVR
ncbi:hypothetical protein C7N43_08745 [Sphingobacteriales bacterium UPWRP_1]|nr:hypothetical protein BVG80_10850 [Sphingobacteriales bacterium TSM_CSM]PSJ77417.1 hypothetical protein C7N43_08745 [Sphingobacteriales bacterium UPWRP_1]